MKKNTWWVVLYIIISGLHSIYATSENALGKGDESPISNISESEISSYSDSEVEDEGRVKLSKESEKKIQSMVQNNQVATPLYNKKAQELTFALYETKQQLEQANKSTITQKQDYLYNNGTESSIDYTLDLAFEVTESTNSIQTNPTPKNISSPNKSPQKIFIPNTYKVNQHLFHTNLPSGVPMLTNLNTNETNHLINQLNEPLRKHSNTPPVLKKPTHQRTLSMQTQAGDSTTIVVPNIDTQQNNLRKIKRSQPYIIHPLDAIVSVIFICILYFAYKLYKNYYPVVKDFSKSHKLSYRQKSIL